jgi:hypothetical protein
MSQNTNSNQTTSQNVLAEVADVLSNSAGDTRSKLVTLLTERELTRRVNILDKALVKREQLLSETFKAARIKKTFTVVDAGLVAEVPSVLTEDEAKAFTKANKQAKENLAKFDAMLEAALTAPTSQVFDKLDKAVSGKGTVEDTAE